MMMMMILVVMIIITMIFLLVSMVIILLSIIIRILKENPEVYQLYKDLVVSGVITSEEFWANRGKVRQ
jgi:hypothetical protein